MTATPFAFVDGALDRADALRDDADALHALWPDARVVLLDDDGRALADDDSQLMAPTGRDLAFSGITISRCRDGRIVEEWELTDTAGLLRQVGVLSEMARG